MGLAFAPELVGFLVGLGQDNFHPPVGLRPAPAGLFLSLGPEFTGYLFPVGPHTLENPAGNFPREVGAFDTDVKHDDTERFRLGGQLVAGRLGLAKGAKAETLMGLSGIGDLVLTCNAMQSRNFSLGVALGQGEDLNGILAARTSVAEGVFSAASVSELAGSLSIDMPLSVAVDGILNHFADIDATIEGLLARPAGAEQ